MKLILLHIIFVILSCSLKAQQSETIFESDELEILTSLSLEKLPISDSAKEIYRLTCVQYGFFPFTIKVEKDKDSLNFKLESQSFDINLDTGKKEFKMFLERDFDYLLDYNLWDTIQLSINNFDFWNQTQNNKIEYTNGSLPCVGIGGEVLFEGVKEGEYYYIQRSFLFKENQVSKELEELCKLFMNLRTIGVDKIYWDGSY